MFVFYLSSGVNYCGSLDVSDVVDGADSVSYTHLDVYKRQVPLTAGCVPFSPAKQLKL